MIMLEINALIPGMQLAQSIKTTSGAIILEQGRILKKECIKILVNLGVSCVNVVLPTQLEHGGSCVFKAAKETIDSIISNFETIESHYDNPVAKWEELGDYYSALKLDIAAISDTLCQLKTHNEYSFKHAMNVSILAGYIGKLLGYTHETLKDLIVAGMLHDIGKIFIPLKVLNKPGKLTVNEMETIKKHPLFSYMILKNKSKISNEVKLSVLQHHERLDGEGYPYGLRKNDISVFAKIIAIADVFDAMTNERVYRSPLSQREAMQIIADDLAVKLDLDIGSIFLAGIRKSYLG